MNTNRTLAATVVSLSAFATALYGSNSDSTLLENSLKESPSAREMHQTNFNADALAPRYVVFLQQYSPEILAASEKYDVPAVLIDAALVEENYGRHKRDDWKDSVALAWNKTGGSWTGYTIDASLGPGQVNMSTAQFLDSYFHLPSPTGVHLSEVLLDPVSNIEYVAMNLSYLTHRSNRQPVSGTILDDPHLIAVTGTEYVRGPTHTPLAEADISMEGGASFAWCLSNIPTKKIHGIDDLITPAQQDAIRAYAKQEITQYALASR